MIGAWSLATLLAVFVIATVLPINMGILAFAAAFVIGAVSGVSMDDVLGFFPGDMFVLLVGITLLFGVAKANGTIDVVVSASVKLARGRRWAIVWIFYFLAAGLMSIGAVVSIGMLAPIAMPLAARYRIKPLLMAMMLGHGGMSAAFSPLTVFGALTASLAKKNGIDVSPLALFAAPFVLGLLIALVLFFVLGRDLFREADESRRTGRRAPAPGTDVVAAEGGRGFEAGGSGAGVRATTATKPARSTAAVTTAATGSTAPALTPLRVVTLVAMLGLLVSTAAFSLDVGVTAFGLGTVLLIIAPHRHKDALAGVSWSAVLLVCGMLTLMAVLSKNGTLDAVGHATAAVGSPMVAALILCYAVAILSAFGSSVGTLGIAIPLAVPLLASGEVFSVGLVLAIAFCSTVVDVSPFSSNGAMVLAQAEVTDKIAFQRRMLGYAGIVTAVAPVVGWIALVVPGSL